MCLPEVHVSNIVEPPVDEVLIERQEDSSHRWLDDSLASIAMMADALTYKDVSIDLEESKME